MLDLLNLHNQGGYPSRVCSTLEVFISSSVREAYPYPYIHMLHTDMWMRERGIPIQMHTHVYPCCTQAMDG